MLHTINNQVVICKKLFTFCAFVILIDLQYLFFCDFFIAEGVEDFLQLNVRGIGLKISGYFMSVQRQGLGPKCCSSNFYI